MLSRVILIVLLVVVLGTPLALQRPQERSASSGDVRQLIIVTPHNEQIRHEFKTAFEAWHRAEFDEPVNVVFNVPGGTSEIRKLLFSEFEAAVRAGREPGGSVDLIFGGGSYEHSQFKSGTRIPGDDNTPIDIPISAPFDLDQAAIDAAYGGRTRIGDERLFDEDQHWFGLALSGFGIVYNRDALRAAYGHAGDDVDVDDPTSWTELCDPRLRGWVALVNPAQSGSITTAFDAILQRRGWTDGWRVLRRASANARYFSASSLKPPHDVSSGDAAIGVCIDFYGRYQAQAMREAGDPDRIGYVDPPGETFIDPDPISLVRGAPEPELAHRFLAFCLSERGQALWQFRTDDPVDDGLGPERFELRRMPIRPSMYQAHMDRMIDQVNPFEIARGVENPQRAIRSFIPVMFSAMAMENHAYLEEAWAAITSHPAYPTGPDAPPIVTAADVTDPDLQAMLTHFDAMPGLPGPDGTEFSLAGPEHLSALKAGWLRGGWTDRGLWPKDGEAAEEMKRRWSSFFRERYAEVVGD